MDFVLTFLSFTYYETISCSTTYRNVASRSTSPLLAHPTIFRMIMKGKFDTARDFTVYNMAIPVVEFSNQGYKIRKIFA